MPPASARTIRAGDDADARAGRPPSRPRRKSSTPWTTPQPIEPRTHSPIPSDRPMTSEEDGEDDERDRQRTERRDTTDLAGDRARFGLGQVDVGDDERHERVAGRADLRAKSRGRLARSARASRPGGGAASTAGAAVGVDGVELSAGSSRIVLRSRSVEGVSRDDSSAVAPAPDARGRADATLAGMSARPPRRLLTAELLSIGSELTVGETRDTNAGELARALTAAGRPRDPPDGPAGRPRSRSRRRYGPGSGGATSSSPPAASARRRTT